ncbi:hypothetical protein ACFQO8_09690 [Exiguobacterium aestuarii]|uniref:DUF1832 domain-containing protein n=1 Tax=Exiguobacterium aestuarii TaxID=273527 RepID=A0ABW2PLR9_9BACL|nr:MULTISPECIES: hypothetical protein [Exiguobacterium]MCT4784762.1 hypothetical protein [Exiguobacterium aestuarii]
MDSKGIKLSQVSKNRIDTIIGHIEHYVPKDTRPFVIKLSLMHGIENHSISSELPTELSSSAWEMGSIINGNDYLLAKHLIINELQKEIDDEKIIRDHMKRFIELGVKDIASLLESDDAIFEEEFLIKLLSV